MPRHQLGIAVGTMNFCRSLLGTMLVAVFGAIVAAPTIERSSPGTLGGARDLDAVLAAQAFRRVFFAAAGALTIAVVAIALLEEKPLQTDAVADTK